MKLRSHRAAEVPQFILETAPNANIVVTQPRRLSALSLAQRVAEELHTSDTPSSSPRPPRLVENTN